MPEEKPWAGPKEANSVPTGLALSVEVFEFEMTDYLRKRIGSVH